MSNDVHILDDETTDETNKAAAEPSTGAQQGKPVSGTTTDFQKSRRNRRILAAIGAAGAIGGGMFLYNKSGQETTAQKAAQKATASVPTFTNGNKGATKPEQKAPARLEVTPANFSFGTTKVGAPKKTQSFVVKVVSGAYEIAQVSLPFGSDQGMTLATGDSGCQGRSLKANDRCTIAVTFEPTGPVVANAPLTIMGTSYDETGRSQSFSETIDLTGTAVAPERPPEAAPNAPPSAPQQVRNTPLMDARNRFLAQRQRATLGGGSSGTSAPLTPRRPIDTDWKDVGYAGSISTYPVDRTRIVTMDKGIPVTIRYEVDTRMAGPVIGIVERDIYGGDGRTPVIEHASKAYGTVTAVANASDEKVAIAWQMIERPDGARFRITGLSGDAMGRAGVLAHIDNRYPERFLSAAAVSIVDAAGVAVTAGNSTTTNTGGTSVGGLVVGGSSATTIDGRTIAAGALQRNVSPLISQFEKERLSLPVLRTIPMGTRVIIWPSEDLILKPVETRESLREAAERQASRQPQTTNSGIGGNQQPYAPIPPQRTAPVPYPAPYGYPPPPGYSYPGQPPLPPVPGSETGNALGPSGASILRQQQERMRQLELQQPQAPGGYPLGLPNPYENGIMR